MCVTCAHCFNQLKPAYLAWILFLFKMFNFTSSKPIENARESIFWRCYDYAVKLVKSLDIEPDIPRIAGRQIYHASASTPCDYYLRNMCLPFLNHLIDGLNTRFDKSSVIRQKGESQNGCFKKTKHAKFFEKRTFLNPWYTYVCVSGVKKCSFFGKFGVLCFLETPVLRFTLLT